MESDKVNKKKYFSNIRDKKKAIVNIRSTNE